ncbi:hypothetical protein BKA56DRAFT_622430 [Ilyonectria sp. MPI-CAGE-AT-0026]|nr:hypothetical protein BKA56DRAFT_622430 [Ilyonectria sp. MPI-CAGE-AT-0026]
MKITFPSELALEKSPLRIFSTPEFTTKSKTEDVSSSTLPNVVQGIDYLSGYLTVTLETVRLSQYLAYELIIPVLDQLHSMLWIFSIKSEHSVDPIHRQRIKGREIVPTQEAKLHLVEPMTRFTSRPCRYACSIILHGKRFYNPRNKVQLSQCPAQLLTDELP